MHIKEINHSMTVPPMAVLEYFRKVTLKIYGGKSLN